jgi:hypothetical protein
MSDGITGRGELGDLNAASADNAVQMVCTDPNFLERAAEKKPIFIARLMQGAYSYPRDWWCGIFYCCMQAGVFGEDGKSRSDPWRRDLETILDFIVKQPRLAVRLLGAYTKHQARSPEFYGRLGGGVFTSYASTGGRLGRRMINGPTKVGAGVANFILANTGAAVLTVKYGGKDVASVFTAMLTGDYEHRIDSALYKELFREAVESREPLDQAEADALVKITEGILHCLRNPGAYIPDEIQ